MDASTPSFTKIIEFLPFIIITVILLVGFFTWEVFTKHISVFVLLITSILFSIWLYSGDIYSYLKWKNAAGGNGGDPILPSPSSPLQLSTETIIWVVLGVILFLAFGLLFGLTSYTFGNKVGQTNQSSILEYISYGFLGVGSIILISVLWKAFRGDNDSSSEATANESPFASTRFKLASGLVLAVIGIYMKVRSVKIGSSQSQQVNPDNAKEIVASISDVVLNIGLIFQVIAVLVTLYMMYRYKVFHPDSGSGKLFIIIRFIPVVLLFIAGFLFIATHQKWIPTASGIEVGPEQNNLFAAHGIVYMVLAGLALVGGLGNIDKIIVFKSIGWIIIGAFIAVAIWNFVALNQKSNFNLDKSDAANGNAYYQQVKEEVVKQMTASGELKNLTPDESEQKIKDKIQKRIDQLSETNNKASAVVSNLFLSLAVILMVVICVFYFAKMKIVECMKIPNGVMNIFKGDCSDPNSYQVNQNLNKKLNGNAATIETLTADQWGEITKNGGFSATLASLSRWNPFWSLITVILCISIVYTNVSTSDTTMEWIAKSFRGDMFPRVKELLDTFFIVFIVGLLLCAILLIPSVKEQNIVALETITKFIDSVQVWQWKENSEQPGIGKWIGIVLLVVAVLSVGLSWLWKQLAETGGVFPKHLTIVVEIVILYALCCLPIFYHMIGGGGFHESFANDNRFIKGLRTLLTSVYLVPVLLIALFKLFIYGIVWVIGKLRNSPEFTAPFENQLSFFDFTKWHAAKDANTDRGTDLRLFGLGKIPIPTEVTTAPAAAGVAGAPAAAGAAAGVAGAPAAAGAAAGVAGAPAAAGAAGAAAPVSPEQTKINAVGSLIKVIFIVIAIVVIILSIIYTVYKFGANSNASGGESSTADGGFVTQMNSPTAHTIYAIMAIVAIAGFVAHLREKFKSANAEKSPEDYLFNDVKPEDASSPMRQLTFALTHIIYIVLMIIVWVYDRDVDDKNRMSVTGMTILGIAILLFHYGLEFIDNRLPREPGAGADTANEPPKMAPLRNLLSNVRFIMNTVFFIVLCALAYYKQHGIMVALIVFMFLFHLTKSILGLKLLQFLWSCILYIPCLFLDFLQSSQSAVGDTTRPIWIIVAIELLLIAILYGGPYLLNYIGASASQMVAAPVALKELYDTNLTTQSPQIFIFHNTGMDRTPEDTAANCPIEEKKRYNYSISGWFILYNNISIKNQDLEIFNFGDTPKMTYNPFTNELKLICSTVNITTRNAEMTEIYNSRKIYNEYTKTSGMNLARNAKFQMLTENNDLDSDIPLQRWNYFVVNYDGKTMDLFLNNDLIFRSEFIMPDIQLKPITVGSENGLNGNICNFQFHKYPLTKEQMRWTYKMLKSQNPPMIGTQTFQDEIKEAGSAIKSRTAIMYTN
jgi:hypothetical protein